MTYVLVGMQSFLVLYVACGSVFMLLILASVARRPGSLDAIASQIDLSLEGVTYRAMLAVVLAVSFMLWPLMLFSMVDNDGNWRG